MATVRGWSGARGVWIVFVTAVVAVAASGCGNGTTEPPEVGEGDDPAEPRGTPSAGPGEPAERGQDAVDGVVALTAPVISAELLASQLDAYHQRRNKTALELQPWRHTTTMEIASASGRTGIASLIDLQPSVHSWYVLRLEWVGGGDPEVYHLQNPDPSGLWLELDPEAGSVVLVRGEERTPCALWGEDNPQALAHARDERWPFTALCGDQLLLRTTTVGRRSKKEMAADFLRDNVWGGEKITTVTRDTLYKDSYRKKGELSKDRAGAAVEGAGRPAPPRLAAGASDRFIEPAGLGLTLERESDGKLVVGRWYPVQDVPGVFVSALRPDAVAEEIAARQGGAVARLDAKERAALAYLVAFDLAPLDLGFALGTDHPRVAWSERAGATVRDAGLPGPDGIGTVAPLVRTGMLDPVTATRAVATFTGGFKRSHSAFKTGELAKVNQGSHYGFIEEGVVLSKLQPGLSTLAVDTAGHVTMDTWTTERDAELSTLRYARQNGVAILEPDPAGGVQPGALLTKWGDGNWSGSEDKKLRSLRAGVCLQESDRGTFLLYGYFSAATPSAMAQVFEAYGCSYAMTTDMNALEHTYLAVYRAGPDGVTVEHLIDEMAVLDQVVDGQPVPRFVGFPDNRDFFFVTRRPAP